MEGRKLVAKDSRSVDRKLSKRFGKKDSVRAIMAPKRDRVLEDVSDVGLIDSPCYKISSTSSPVYKLGSVRETTDLLKRKSGGQGIQAGLVGGRGSIFQGRAMIRERLLPVFTNNQERKHSLKKGDIQKRPDKMIPTGQFLSRSMQMARTARASGGDEDEEVDEEGEEEGGPHPEVRFEDMLYLWDLNRDMKDLVHSRIRDLGLPKFLGMGIANKGNVAPQVVIPEPGPISAVEAELRVAVEDPSFIEARWH